MGYDFYKCCGKELECGIVYIHTVHIYSIRNLLS